MWLLAPLPPLPYGRYVEASRLVVATVSVMAFVIVDVFVVQNLVFPLVFTLIVD